MSRARSVSELGNQTLNLSVTEGSLKVGTGITFENTGQTQFSGIITATQFVGDGSGLTGITATGSGVVVQEEGSSVGTAATINFIGSNVTAAISGGVASVTITGGSGGLSNVVEDTTPQLGGNLDLNSKDITGTGRVNITGIITATTFSGSGASLTSIPAGELTGTVVDARLTTVSSSKLSGALPAISGASLTNLTGASAATYGSSTAVPVITVDSNGRISAISTTGVSGGGGGGGIDNIVQDTTPQLGGNLDLNSKNITGTGNVNITGVITATSFDGNLATTDLTGTITNAQLAGSIANSKLANSSIAIGGVTLNLGDTDATPAFNLSDATNIPSAQLTGSLPAISGSALTGVVTSITAGSNVTLTGGPAGSITIAATVGTIAGVDTTGTSHFNNLTVAGVSTFKDNIKIDGTGANIEFTSSSASGTSQYMKFWVGNNSGTHYATLDGSAGSFQIWNTSHPTGSLDFRAKEDFSFQVNGYYSILNQSNGGVKLYHPGSQGNILSQKFETTSTGVVITGVATATSFSGSGIGLTSIPAGQLTGTLPAISGASLTTLNASELDSGTIPDARFPSTLPAVSGANLTNIPEPDEASVTSYTITANGSSAYRFSGGGVDSTADNPDLYLIRGQKYRFNNTTGSNHPFRFRASSGGSTYSTGVSGSENGVQLFTVPLDAPSQLVYQCTLHNAMVGNIYINGADLYHVFSQTSQAVSALEIDCSTGNFFTKAITGDATFTFANVPSSGTAFSFTIEIDVTGSSTAITWPNSVKWNGGSAPSLTDTKTHLFMFVTNDGGTTFRGAALVDYTT